MKRIAIVSPCILPVPDIKGGAVEGLITSIISDNERYKKYYIDLFTIDHAGIIDKSFSYTRLFTISSGLLTKTADRFIDKYYRTVSAESSKRMLDSLIIKRFLERLKDIQGSYDAVIIENMMSTACEIVHLCEGKYDFPIFFHMHNDVDLYRSPKQIRELVRFGVRFLAVSDYIREQIFKCDKNATVSLLYNGIDLAQYEKRNTIQSDTFSFLYTGRIIPGKGVKELVLAFIKAFEGEDDSVKDRIRLDIVGFSGIDRRYERGIRELAEKYSFICCKDQISHDDMPLLYDKADVVVMPTIDEEPFGLVALETMAKGIPLITTNSGALPEVVGDGAIIVDKSNDFVANLSRAIKRVAFDDELRKELSDKAYYRARSVKEFDIRNYYNNFIDLIVEERITSEDVISVIVPVYNVSSYLRRCVDSIIHQTYDNLEILLVDDGSTDESGTICDEYMVSDSRIKAFHQENIGLSGARNKGLDNAKGRYIFFCDSDDFLQTDALEKMLKKLKTDRVDVVACGIELVFVQTTESSGEQELFTDTRPGRWSGYESVIQMMRSNNVCSVAWNKLYKRSLFEGIRFPLGVQNEDEATTYKILYRAKMVSFIPDRLYKYYQRKESIIHQELDSRYIFFVNACIDRIAFFHDKGEDELEQHSRISLLEWIKHSYRNIDNKEKKYELVGVYRDNIDNYNAPSVMGMKKKMALLLWKYFRY